MKKYLLLFYLFFSFLVNCIGAAPPVQQQTVDFLRPKLNSERIEFFFGSYGVDTLKIESPLFPLSRMSNLHSIQKDKKIMRTLAIVEFFQPMHADLHEVHHTIMVGKSIGAALQAQGWVIHKKPIYFGEICLSKAVMSWMDEKNVEEAALHIYQLEVSKKGEEESIPYCTIFEVHSPQYLTKDWLQALYEKQHYEFSVPSHEITIMLLRLFLFIQDFPSPLEYESNNIKK